MLISIKKKIAFLAMTKAGSTAIEAALGPHCDIHFTGDPRVKHMTLSKFERFVRPYLRSMGAADVETMCLVREPEDWLRSWYRYRGRSDLSGHPNSTEGMTFDAFVEAYLSDPQPAFAAVGRPTRFVAGEDGAPGVDRMFRYEAMGSVTAFLSERFGREIDLKRANVSPARSAELGAGLRARLRFDLAADYALHELADA